MKNLFLRVALACGTITGHCIFIIQALFSDTFTGFIKIILSLWRRASLQENRFYLSTRMAETAVTLEIIGNNFLGRIYKINMTELNPVEKKQTLFTTCEVAAIQL